MSIGGELKAALYQVLEREAEMLRAIHGHQGRAAASGQARRLHRFLEKVNRQSAIVGNV